MSEDSARSGGYVALVGSRRARAWRLACALSLLAPAFAPVARAQDGGAAALGSAIAGLGVTARVLIIGAHPDDEDTQVIAWLSRGRHVETAYLSLTRGDGGQNAIGNELGEALGVIRTEELLAARRVDGATQFFSRAYDFGFSKNADEAFRQWPHDSLLRDVLTVVRAFRPHVIISVFTGTPRDGHGQHQVAGILAREAWDWAGDSVRFPRTATAGFGPWTVLKFYRGASFRRENATLQMNVGEYDPLLGRSYAEVAAISRSQHRSQAFGTLPQKGVRYDYLQREATRVAAPEDPKAERSLFDGIDTTWARFRGRLSSNAAEAALDSLPAALRAARASFDAYAPERAIPALVRVSRLTGTLCATVLGSDRRCGQLDGADAGVPGDAADLEASVSSVHFRVARALALAAGVAVEATATRDVWATDETVPVQLTLYNRGPVAVRVVHAGVAVGGSQPDERMLPVDLAPDSAWTRQFSGGRFGRVTQPGWLVRPRQGAMFDYAVIGESLSGREPRAMVVLQIGGEDVTIRVPVVRRYADQVRGEINRPIAGVPGVSVLLDEEVEYAPARSPIERDIRVHLQSAGTGPRDVRVTLRLPAGLVADSAERSVALVEPGVVRTVAFHVRGQLPAGRHLIEATATSGGQTYSAGYTTIDYEHIQPRRIYRSSRLAIEAVDVAATGSMRVAYIQGVGDNSAAALSQLGLQVALLDPAALSQADLRGYNAIVVGPRAYESSPALVANNGRLLDYVRDGGTLVVQYGQYEMTQPGIMPYPITINRPHDRVTVEDAPVTILDPATAVLRGPNRITGADFDGWIQDRSLYMPRTFDPHYVPSLAMNDPGEPPNRGALLVAPYGKGTYVYTTLAFFRQLPNGVPGAARLFVNLLAAKATGTAQ